MARHRKQPQANTDLADAMRIARGTQQPGQTKEQTRLIAKGIQKGIEQYRKQHSAKTRELDKRLRKASQSPAPTAPEKVEVRETVVYRQHWLPWVLLAISWIGMGVYWLVYG
jgi:hypothetical protein